MNVLPLLVIVVALATPDDGQTAVPQARLVGECESGNQRSCEQLARTALDVDVRMGAIRKLNDQQLLAQLASTEKTGRARVCAINALVDQDALVKIARTHASPVERAVAAERLLDQSVVADIARKDASKWVRRKAAYALHDLEQIQKLVAEGRKELLPTLTVGAGLKHVKLDGKELKETLIGIATALPGSHTISSDFSVRENVIWESTSLTSTTWDARLGGSYYLESEMGPVHWDYLAPGTREGRGAWKLVVHEQISTGPDLLPTLLRR